MSSETIQTKSLSRYGAFALLILALSSLFCLILLIPKGLNLDSTMYLEVGRYLLDGRLPYVDYVELNPPLIHYVNITPAFLSELSGLNPIFVYKLMMFAFILYSTFVTRYLILKLTGSPYSLETNIIPIIIVIVAIEVHAGHQGYSMFGQREHLLSLFIIPWIILRPLKAINTPVTVTQSIIIAIFAAIGIALKPFFVLPLLVIEIYLLIRYRNWRLVFAPEVWAFATVGFVYLAHFFILPSAVREGFFDSLIPAITEGYGSYSLGSTQFIIVFFLMFPGVFAPGIFWLTGLIIAVFVKREQNNYLSPFFIPFIFLAAGSFVAYLIQGIGFLYHMLPFYVAIFIAIIIRLSPKSSSTGQQSDDIQSNRLSYSVVALLIITTTLYSGFTAMQTHDSSFETLKDYIQDESAGESSIFFVDTSLYPTFPLLLQIDRQHNVSYPVALPIAFGLYHYENPEALYEGSPLPEQIEAYLSRLSADIAQYQPPLILIKTGGCAACPENFDINRMLIGSGFIETQILPDYSRNDVSGITDFVIYKRQSN